MISSLATTCDGNLPPGPKRCPSFAAWHHSSTALCCYWVQVQKLSNHVGDREFGGLNTECEVHVGKAGVRLGCAPRNGRYRLFTADHASRLRVAS